MRLANGHFDLVLTDRQMPVSRAATSKTRMQKLIWPQRDKRQNSNDRNFRKAMSSCPCCSRNPDCFRCQGRGYYDGKLPHLGAPQRKRPNRKSGSNGGDTTKLSPSNASKTEERDNIRAEPQSCVPRVTRAEARAALFEPLIDLIKNIE